MLTKARLELLAKTFNKKARASFKLMQHEKKLFCIYFILQDYTQTFKKQNFDVIWCYFKWAATIQNSILGRQLSKISKLQKKSKSVVGFIGMHFKKIEIV